MGEEKRILFQGAQKLVERLITHDDFLAFTGDSVQRIRVSGSKLSLRGLSVGKGG
jgi:hypothetical protein